MDSLCDNLRLMSDEDNTYDVKIPPGSKSRIDGGRYFWIERPGCEIEVIDLITHERWVFYGTPGVVFPTSNYGS